MKKNLRFNLFGPTALGCLMTLAGTTWAVSPYDVPYGVQWNYMIGAIGSDVGVGSRLDVTSDGTVFINNRTGASTWGSGTGGNVRGGVGAISPLGNLLYGTTISSLPTMNAANQQYAAGVSAVGNKAYFTVYGAQDQYWTGEDGKDPNRAMVWSMNSSGLSSIADQHSLSKYYRVSNVQTLRTDTLQPTSTGLSFGGQNRISASDLRDSTLDMVMVMDMVSGDFATAGDYEGYGLRTSSNAFRDPAYLPGIGVYNFTSNTLSGPAKQPILTFDTSADVFEVFTIQCVADTAGSLNSKFFDVLGTNGNHRFWYSVDGGGTEPGNPPNPNGGKYKIDIAANATADAVAAATQAVIDAQGAFGATVASDVLTVTLAYAGNSTQTDSGGTAFTFTETTAGFKTAGSNMSSYNVAAIDQATGFYFGGGISHSRTESTSTAWDPDASGPAPLIPFVTSTSSGNPAGIGTAYDSSHNLLYAVTWDTTGYDIISAIATTNDGSNGAFWAGEKLDDCYIELRDATGAIVWSDSFDMSPSVELDSVNAPGVFTPGVERVFSVRVETNGDLLVAGYFENGGAGGGTAAYDNFLRKYEKTGTNTYAVKWTTTAGQAGSRQLGYDIALDPGEDTLYLLSETLATLPNVTGFVRSETNANNNDLLLQKMSPGDFNSDGLVNFADVQIAGTATKPGLIGDDSYDFNRDGDSTLADTTYMITNIMDLLVGDIAQDTLVTDVDNADIGRAIGASGVGTLYLDGDIDFDGDVDAGDISAVAATFSGAKTPSGYGSTLAVGATLRYRPDDGQVWLYANEAAGGIVTSYQLENAAGTFVSGSFTGPTGGSFGGALKEATANVLADTDLTLAGASGTDGLISLGTVFPTGMDLAALQAYLKTAVYTGEAGSGQKQFTLVVGDILPPFQTWAAGFPTLTKPYANIDFDGGGLASGIEWIVGGDPTNPGDDAGNLPTLDNSDPNAFKFVFKRRDEAAADSNTTIVVEYGTDLSTWRNTADHGAIDGVTIDDSTDLGGGFHQVAVSIPKTLAPGGKLFARLGVSGLPVSLFDADFKDDNGGFTVATASGSDWEFGTPNTPNPGGGALTGGNTDANCWGTKLNDVYAAGTDTKLRSPVIDLTGVTSASLSFAQAIDILSPHTLVVNVIEEATETILQSAIHTSTPDTNTTSAAWETVTVATPITGGQKVRIEWHFVGNGDGFYLGAYIDDVLVTSP
ncbi:MAG: hypothetical protein ACO3JG_04015 [Luteolibacter sp.]